MVAKRHKITNVPPFKKIWDIIFFFGTITLWAIFWDILRGPQLFWPPQNVPWNGSYSKVIVPQKKKIMSHSFLNSGTWILNSYTSLICGPGWFERWKNWRSKISLDCSFKKYSKNGKISNNKIIWSRWENCVSTWLFTVSTVLVAQPNEGVNSKRNYFFLKTYADMQFILSTNRV